MNRYQKLYKSKILIMLGMIIFFMMTTTTTVFASVLWEDYSIPATRQKPLVYDMAELLDSSDEASLSSYLEELSAKHRCNIAVLTVWEHNGPIQDYADDYFDYNGFGADYNGSGILFMLSMADREWAISTSGDAIYAFTDYGQEVMIDDMMEDLGGGYYYDALKTYGKTADRYLEMYAQGTPFDVGTESVKTTSDLAKGAVGSVVFGLLAALIPIFVMKSELNTVHMNASASGYQSHEGIHMSVHRDSFRNQTLSKSPIPKETESRGSSGGSSVHTSSSGSSHGGSHGHF